MKKLEGLLEFEVVDPIKLSVSEYNNMPIKTASCYASAKKSTLNSIEDNKILLSSISYRDSVSYIKYVVKNGTNIFESELNLQMYSLDHGKTESYDSKYIVKKGKELLTIEAGIFAVDEVLKQFRDKDITNYYQEKQTSKYAQRMLSFFKDIGVSSENVKIIRSEISIFIEERKIFKCTNLS